MSLVGKGMPCGIAARPPVWPPWGEDRYGQLVELLTVELHRIDVRVTRTSNDGDAARMREAVIKELPDARIGACSCGSVVNIGAHHAHLTGTDQGWLGDHLAHVSEIVDGSIVVIGFTSAATELEPGAGGTPWTIRDSASPEHELLRLLAETLPDETVLMPLDDVLFTERTVAYNSEDEIYVTALARQFDAVVHYGLAHRMPSD